MKPKCFIERIKDIKLKLSHKMIEKETLICYNVNVCLEGYYARPS